ncbi:MAG TPA: crossover junction endodeoxyribonuclease RuvC [Longimicrobium sp.]|nr:crossover junction endodeoxyribonuclease RuvC [Longimicrobium sp.]
MSTASPRSDAPPAPARPGEAVILGVDPGTAVTGYGVVARAGDGAVSLLECGVIRTHPRAPLAERLRDIHEGVLEVISRRQPSVIAVESAFYSKNVRTSMVLGHARGVILLSAALRDLPLAEYPPAEVKSAVVGAGAATKEQVGYMVQRLLRLKEPPKPHDAADGVAIALCHCFRGFGPAARASAQVAALRMAITPPRLRP